MAAIAETMFSRAVRDGSMEAFERMITVLQNQNKNHPLFFKELLCRTPEKSQRLFELVLKRGLSNKQGISLITSAIEKGNTPRSEGTLQTGVSSRQNSFHPTEPSLLQEDS